MPLKVSRSWDKVKPWSGQSNSGETKTEQAGYRDTKTIVSEMMVAGARLTGFRQAYYAPGEDQSVPDEDVTKEPGFDLADAQRIGQELGERARKRVEARKARKRVEEVQEPPGAPEGKPEGKKKGGSGDSAGEKVS